MGSLATNVLLVVAFHLDNSFVVAASWTAAVAKRKTFHVLHNLQRNNLEQFQAVDTQVYSSSLVLIHFELVHLL